MTSDFNTNPRTRNYSYTTAEYDEYQIAANTAVNYDDRISLQGQSTAVRLRHYNYSDNKSKDELSNMLSVGKPGEVNEYHSLQRRTVSRHLTPFKNLPIKARKSTIIVSSETINPQKVDKLQLTQNYSSSIETTASPQQEFTQSYLKFDNLEYSPDSNLSNKNVSLAASPLEEIVPQRQLQSESAPIQFSFQRPQSQEDTVSLETENTKLRRYSQRMANKVTHLQERNQDLQKRYRDLESHVKNLLDERKQILKQVENSEFEEIIEEEETLKPKERIEAVKYVQSEAMNVPNVSHDNCIQRGQISLDDVPQEMLESFVNKVLSVHNERAEIEKRSLMEALQTEHWQEIQSMETQYKTKQVSVKHAGIQCSSKGVFNQKVSEVNFRRTPSPKPYSRSVGLNVSISVTNKQCQCEFDEEGSRLGQYISNKRISKSEKSFLEDIAKFVKENNYDELLELFGKHLYRSSASIGINNIPLCFSKGTSMNHSKSVDLKTDVNMVTEAVKPKTYQEHRGVLVKPLMFPRGSQCDQIFRFETQTMTEHALSRSQGVMTTEDYPSESHGYKLKNEEVINENSIEVKTFNTDESKRSINVELKEKKKEEIVLVNIKEESEQTFHFDQRNKYVTEEGANSQSSLPLFSVERTNGHDPNFHTFESEVTIMKDPFKETESSVSTVEITRKIPINVIRGSSSASSYSSSVHSIPVTFGSFTTEFGEEYFTEVIYVMCCQLFVWLRTVNLVTILTVNHLPHHLVTVSTNLIEWWNNMTSKISSSKLSSLLKYFISTFNKMLLKYFIITQDTQGETYLHYIVYNQLWDLFDVLDSAYLIDPNVYNSKGYTVLMAFCFLKITTDRDLGILRRLILNANINLKSRFQGQTAIFIAALHDNSEAIQMLYTMGADINIRDNDDNTPLMAACLKDNLNAVTIILSWTGTLVDLKNKDGKTAIDIASEGQHADLLGVFQQRKAMKATEISAYSCAVQNSYRSKCFGIRRF